MQEQGNGGNDGLIAIILFTLAGVALMMWQGHRVLGFSRAIDLLPLKLYAFILPGAVGGFFEQLSSQYASYHSKSLTLAHQAFAGRYAWYPILTPFAFFLIFQGFKVRKIRMRQQFRIMDRDHLSNLYAERKPSDREREPWTVNRWFVFYKLRGMAWRSPEWMDRVEKALIMQLGKPNPTASMSDEDLLANANPLVLKFAQLLNAIAEARAKKEKKPANLPPPEQMALKALRAHGYPSGSILRLLAAGRERDGFISVNRFKNDLFVDASSTPVWWALNALGRQTVHIEALGILSHFYREIAYQERLDEPDLTWALEGLDRIREYRVKNSIGDLTEQVEISPPAIRATI
ncbi:MAG: hypothetical protein IBX50_06030 [Marinospirillum sp.]|uniref:secretion/conjugation apparatus DotM-related subunit n=1 Tax=Marinospirillum sp. TaxID=2183934 RepID=UPI001A076619|nr:hypothetical protein [Marinospirillum sp.]MBE0506265.1 hypothetical protein [Marinospirillum sp.]